MDEGEHHSSNRVIQSEVVVTELEMGALCSTDTAEQDEWNDGNDNNTIYTSREAKGDDGANTGDGNSNADIDYAAERQKVFDKIIEVAEKKFLSNVSSRRGRASHTSDVDSDPVR